MEAEFPDDLTRANAVIARAEAVAVAVAGLQAQLTEVRRQLVEKERRILAQTHEIQGLRDQLNLFKLAKRFNKTEPSDDHKAKIDSLIEAIDKALGALAQETSPSIQKPVS
jgi:hypothetical protein